MKPIIEIKGLQKTFHTKNGDVTALCGVDLAIQPGDIFGIIGLSGAGKSTLVRCMNLLEKPTAGEVLFDGVSITALKKRELLEMRRSMGMIFQSFNLLTQRTALKNICYPLEIAGKSRAEAEKRARELLKIVGLSDRENAYPAQLSGGQKQRVAIARALANNPKVILCDEATSALDPETTQSILSLLKEINRNMGVTVVIITHEMRVVEEICSHVAIIDHSKIVEEGTVADVFAHPKSEMARRMILPADKVAMQLGGRRLRLIFNGSSSFEPIVADMIFSCRAAVNILFADTKDIDGKAFGQMVLQLPQDEEAVGRILRYLDAHEISYEEGEAVE